jgi:hypothetical protein
MCVRYLSPVEPSSAITEGNNTHAFALPYVWARTACQGNITRRSIFQEIVQTFQVKGQIVPYEHILVLALVSQHYDWTSQRTNVVAVRANTKSSQHGTFSYQAGTKHE